MLKLMLAGAAASAVITAGLVVLARWAGRRTYDRKRLDERLRGL